MPKIRIGFSTDFNLVNEQVGIGTTNPESRLNVPGQILADNTAGSGGVSTYREYQGFHQTQSNVSNTVLIDATTAGNLNSLSGELRIDGDVTIAPDTSVTSGKIDSLTATDKFSVPLGETNNRDNAPEAGTTRFNQDFGTLEFFDGANWKTVNSYARPSRSSRGIFGAQTTGNNGNLEYVNITTLGNTSSFGSLNVQRFLVNGCSSATRGVFGGGYSPTPTYVMQNEIDYVTIASEGNAIEFGDLTVARGRPGSCSSSTRGLWAGGATPALKNEIDLLIKTKSRLNNEQLRLEKDLSRFESRKEALNESRGSYALRILLEAGLEGIHGYVAQLGEVSEKNRYALEIAAGNRLGQIVVDNDHIAAKAIEILKKKKAGRLTFLPLNRIKSQKKNYAISRFENNRENGFIDKAINLITFDEVYSDVFRYVFGDTLVFSDLSSARLSTQKNRLVTLSGELLEASGAITGGSKLNKIWLIGLELIMILMIPVLIKEDY